MIQEHVNSRNNVFKYLSPPGKTVGVLMLAHSAFFVAPSLWIFHTIPICHELVQLSQTGRGRIPENRHLSILPLTSIDAQGIN